MSNAGGTAKSSSHNPVWLISFGDLLTLLWCMILSLVCYGHFRPTSLGKNSQGHQWVKAYPGNVHAKPLANASAGTPLANPAAQEPSAVKPPAVLFTERDFVDANNLSADAEHRLAVLWSPEQSRGAAVTIETCDGADKAGWFSSVNRALLLRGKALRAGIESAAVRLRVVGAHCESLQDENPKAEQARARVTLRTE